MKLNILKDKTLIFLLAIILLTLPIFFQNKLRSDGGAYYIYLPSLFIDHDLDFHNEFRILLDQPESLAWHGTLSQISPAGKVANFFSIGPALLASPFFGIVYLLKKVFHSSSLASILSSSYIFAYTFTSILAGLAAIIAIYKWLKDLNIFHKTSIALSILAIIYGSNFFYYFFINPSMSHIFAFSFISFFIIYWHKTLFKRDNKQWIILGILGGVMSIIRWQEVIFLSLPMFEIIYLFFKNKIKINKILSNIGLLAAGFAPFFFLQFLAWKIIFGSWFLIPQGSGFFEPLSPHIISVLFSARNGLLWWTPIYILGILGFIRLYRINKSLCFLLFFVFLIQFYINSAVVDWAGGYSFGSRRFVDIAIVFIVGMAAIFDYIRQITTQRAIAVFSMTVILFFGAWTALLLIQFQFGQIRGEDNITLSQLLHQQKASLNLLFSRQDY